MGFTAEDKQSTWDS